MTITLIPRGMLYLSQRPPLEDPERLNDWIGQQIELTDARAMLERGTFDNGLIVQMIYHGQPGKMGVIVPDPKGGQMVKPLEAV
jgi:hypothetical protein